MTIEKEEENTIFSGFTFECSFCNKTVIVPLNRDSDGNIDLDNNEYYCPVCGKSHLDYPEKEKPDPITHRLK